MFNIAIVPIEMSINTNSTKLVIWKNKSPSSTRYCRPFKFIFAKENKEVKNVENQITSLNPIDVVIEDSFWYSQILFCV